MSLTRKLLLAAGLVGLTVACGRSNAPVKQEITSKPVEFNYSLPNTVNEEYEGTVTHFVIDRGLASSAPKMVEIDLTAEGGNTPYSVSGIKYEGGNKFTELKIRNNFGLKFWNRTGCEAYWIDGPGRYALDTSKTTCTSEQIRNAVALLNTAENKPAEPWYSRITG